MKEAIETKIYKCGADVPLSWSGISATGCSSEPYHSYLREVKFNTTPKSLEKILSSESPIVHSYEKENWI